jgi:hypothetical protein
MVCPVHYLERIPEKLKINQIGVPIFQCPYVCRFFRVTSRAGEDVKLSQTNTSLLSQTDWPHRPSSWQVAQFSRHRCNSSMHV